MRLRAMFAAALLAGGTLPGPALRAQQTGGNATITGRVTDAESREPLASVTVSIPGTQLGAVTGPDGTYRIARAPARRLIVVARRIGYGVGTDTVTTADGTTATADFALRTSAINLEQVVVTGTAGNQTREAQGAVIATIDAATVDSVAPVLTVSDVLQGRVAGVNVTDASGTLGTAPRINIRGATSISLSNAPLVFIDGVRMYSGSRTDIGTGSSHGLELLGGQSVTALNDLSPDDIESIEIVKGPAAATLYGADASAGVIQIITKKGRVGSRQFTQNISTEFDQIQSHFTPLADYGTCSAKDVLPGAAGLCQGLPAGSVVSFNPLAQANVFHDGQLGGLDYSGHGGGDNFGYFVSATAQNETGTEPSNYYWRRTGRADFNWLPTPQLGLDATVGLSRNDYKIPMGDDATYSYLAQQYALANFRTVKIVNGVETGGLSTPVAGIEAVQNELVTLRLTPSVQARYNPFSWFTNRVTVGADLSSTDGSTFFPKNTQNWYHGDQANGYVESVQNPIDVYTVDYLGTVHGSFGGDRHIASDFSFGSQYINTVTNYLSGIGLGLATNASNLVSSAASNEAHQSYSQDKALGILGQEQLSFGQRLFVQAGARADENSAFGQSFGWIFLPKASVSYVLSQEPFWSRTAPWISTFRLRAAYGATGRSPSPGASLTTYAPFTYVTPTGGVGPGVIQASPGNPKLKPETGTEFEGGFDAGFFQERAGLELTYFDKATSNLLLQQPLAPSLAYAVNPFVNVGKVDNRGLEFTLRATPLDRRGFRWDAALTGSTLSNKLVSLGGITIAPTNEISPDLSFRYVPGKPLAAWYLSEITSIDTVKGVANVTATPVYAGPQFPTSTANLSNTFTFFKNFQVYGLFTSQHGGKILNITPLYRDLVGESAELNLPAGQGGYSKTERIAHSGPFVTPQGTPVALDLARYLQPTDFVRLQELSVTYSLPAVVARQLRAAGASLVVGGRNLALWKSAAFTGPDPEFQSNTVTTGLNQYTSTEEFTVPQLRRWIARLNLQF